MNEKKSVKRTRRVSKKEDYFYVAQKVSKLLSENNVSLAVWVLENELSDSKNSALYAEAIIRLQEYVADSKADKDTRAFITHFQNKLQNNARFMKGVTGERTY